MLKRIILEFLALDSYIFIELDLYLYRSDYLGSAWNVMRCVLHFANVVVRYGNQKLDKLSGGREAKSIGKLFRMGCGGLGVQKSVFEMAFFCFKIVIIKI